MPKPVHKSNCISRSSLVTLFAEDLRKVKTDFLCVCMFNKLKKTHRLMPVYQEMKLNNKNKKQ